MKTLRVALLIVLGVALLAVPRVSRAGTEEILVIAHKSVSVGTASRDQLRPIFQTKTSTWPDGTPVRPFNLPEAVSTRQAFDAAVLNLDPDRVARYWIDRKIRGGERAPTNAPSPALMLRLVAATPGAIGYVPASAVNNTVKVIARVRDGQLVQP